MSGTSSPVAPVAVRRPGPVAREKAPAFALLGRVRQGHGPRLEDEHKQCQQSFGIGQRPAVVIHKSEPLPVRGQDGSEIGAGSLYES